MNRRHNDRSDNLDRRNNNNNNNRQQQRSNFANNNTNNPPGDKLAGMMTEKEKNWVVNVQMLQLQIDDPYTFDFYYTVRERLRVVGFIYKFLLTFARVQGMDVEEEAVLYAEQQLSRAQDLCLVPVEQ